VFQKRFFKKQLESVEEKQIVSENSVADNGEINKDAIQSDENENNSNPV
jgi:hypothetical protein